LILGFGKAPVKEYLDLMITEDWYWCILLLELFDFVNLASSSYKDKTYEKIIGNWNEFINCLPSDKDKQLLLAIISKCYYKYQKALKTNGCSNHELSAGLLMSI
jgi:hypothetical protein